MVGVSHMQYVHALVVACDPDISAAFVEAPEGAGLCVTAARDGRAAPSEYTIDDNAVLGRCAGDRIVVDVTDWIDRKASLRRPFTGRYVPRHRGDGPAV